MAEYGDNPSLGHLHTAFDLGFIARSVGSCGYHAEAVMKCQVQIGRVDVRVIAGRFGDAGAGVIGHGQRRHAAPELEGMFMGADPRFHLLIARDFGVGAGTGTEDGDEQRRLTDGGRVAVMDGDRGTGPVDESFFAGDVMLAHDHALLASPALVDLAVAAVTVTVGVSGMVLLPE